MSDFGAAFDSAYAPRGGSAAAAPFRCEECGMRLPPVNGACSFCGGRVVAVTGGGGGGRAPPPLAQVALPPNVELVEERAAQVLGAIIPTDFLEAAAHPSAPTAKDVLDELPLVKIE